MNSDLLLQDDNKDRLSELPDELLVRTLSFLPIEDAVQTMLLRRFGNLWTLLPTVEFTSNNNQNFVSNVLYSLNNPTIEKLEFNEVNVVSQQNLKNWVDISLRKQPKMFTIRINDDRYEYKLPYRVFTNQSIVSLVLDSVVIKRPKKVYMISLQKLELSNIFIHDKVLEKITSGCPFLREVVIRNSGDTYLVDFTAPQVEKLVLDFSKDGLNAFAGIVCPNIKILHLEETCMDYLGLTDVSSVVECVIKDCYCDYCCESLEPPGFENVLLGCPNANIIRLETEAYLRLKSCGNDQKMTFPINSWTRLALRSTIHGSCLRNICNLLKQSRSLEELIIYADVDYPCNCDILLHKYYRRWVMRKLKTITIREFKIPCNNALLQLVKFLLKSSPYLDEVVISCSKTDQIFSTEGQEFVNQIINFPWASSKVVASIVFA